MEVAVASMNGEQFDPWDAAAGLLVPEFVDEPDGFYNRRIVLDEPLVGATVLTEGSNPETASVVRFHYEPCRIPKTKRVLRWRNWNEV